MEPTERSLMSASKLRGKNWTIEKDEALCIAWLNVSTDVVVGINQNTANLYNRIYENFIEICTAKVVSSNPELRAPKGIKARWHQINKAVCKFAGCIAQITNQQQSGASPEDILKQALTLFASTEHSSFSLMHCFKILESAPKWQQYNVKVLFNSNSLLLYSLSRLRLITLLHCMTQLSLYAAQLKRKKT
ncbi:uncharacterized protein LOC129717204 [Wyeomyia smithii]|uniref:uncharacterized protein LOC129717204 n=1 Tax=Wyeomyia smithii TaxID=174621 RepID=UPI002467FA5F|nr:uncharacterized protein LOC129717204 [Wyeomyia smithii]